MKETGIILLDSGRDIDLQNWTSIVGGSSPQRRTTMDILPTFQHKPKLAFANLETNTRASPSSSRLPASSTYTPSLYLFPQDYGFSLDSKLMRQDAMYALSELFTFAASAESQFLNFMKAEIVAAIRSFDGQEELGLANLRYSKSLLDEHLEYILETTNVILARGSVDWPKSTGSDERDTAEVNEKLTQLTTDYEHLLSKAQTLASLCNDGMSTILNDSMLQESRKAIQQAEGTRRLTILAFLFVPLSMVASVFGMNVEEFGQGKLQIWVPFVVLIPIVGISVMLCFWDDMPWKGREGQKTS